MIRYLVTMARNKVVDESRRRMKYQKHNIDRERPLADAAEPPRRQDTPSQIAMFGNAGPAGCVTSPREIAGSWNCG